jgi:hypothetical protein
MLEFLPEDLDLAEGEVALAAHPDAHELRDGPEAARDGLNETHRPFGRFPI